MSMSNKNVLDRGLHSLDSVEKRRILDALRLLINIFWSGQERKNWTELWNLSPQVWSCLQKIVFKDSPEIVNFIQRQNSLEQSQKILQDFESEFVRIFINTHAGVSAPLYHSCYLDNGNHLMQHPVLDMLDRLQDAGLSRDNPGEPADHLCIELEYLYLLLSLEMQEQDNGLTLEIVDFSGNFMLPWVIRFQRKIPDSGPGRFFFFSAGAMKDLLYFLGGKNNDRPEELTGQEQQKHMGFDRG